MEVNHLEGRWWIPGKRFAWRLCLGLLAGVVLCMTNVWIILDPLPPRVVVAVLRRPSLHPAIVRRPLPGHEQDIVLRAGFETNRITAFGFSDYVAGHPDAVAFRWFRVSETTGRFWYQNYWTRADKLRQELVKTGTTTVETLSADDLHSVAAAAEILRGRGDSEKLAAALSLGAAVAARHEDVSRDLRTYFNLGFGSQRR